MLSVFNWQIFMSLSDSLSISNGWILSFSMDLISSFIYMLGFKNMNQINSVVLFSISEEIIWGNLKKVHKVHQTVDKNVNLYWCKSFWNLCVFFYMTHFFLSIFLKPLIWFTHNLNFFLLFYILYRLFTLHCINSSDGWNSFLFFCEKLHATCYTRKDGLGRTMCSGLIDFSKQISL